MIRLISSSAMPIDEVETCSMAVSCPPRLAPMDNCWIVFGRWPTEVNIWARVSTSFTGRLVTRAASAASVTCGQARSPAPNAPPTNGANTRTPAGSMPNAAASVSRTACGYCVVSWTVSASPSHAATVANRPIGLLVLSVVL